MPQHSFDGLTPTDKSARVVSALAWPEQYGFPVQQGGIGKSRPCPAPEQGLMRPVRVAGQLW